MHHLALTVLVLCAPNAAIEDGSILMLQNSNKAVSSYTDSAISHLAVVLNVAGKPWVYEATPAKVRRAPLDKYMREIGEFNRDREPATLVWLKRPNKPLDSGERARMSKYLNSQLGRRYSIRGYLRDDPGRGIHCAALTAEAIERTGRVDFKQPQRESPTTVMLNVRHLYKYGELMSIPEPQTIDEPFFVRAWTKFSGFRTWCAWSFIESLRFCF